MDWGLILQYIVVGLMVVFVAAIGAGSIIYSYAEEARAKKEMRERAQQRKMGSSDDWF